MLDGSRNVHYNGMKVGAGQWCLPKGINDPQNACGTYTGRAVWSDDQGDQKWSCICLYPDLFGGSDCQSQLACRDLAFPSSDQKDNYLVDKNGKKWDPKDPDFEPANTTPYDVDPETGQPMYQCVCNANAVDPTNSKVQYVKLPGDPYRCHANPCTPNHNDPYKIWDPDTFSCDCSKGDLIKSNVDGVCRSDAEVCKGGHWDKTTQRCDCTGGSESEICNSRYYYRGGSRIEDCEDPTNPVGSYCLAKCSDVLQCANGAPCNYAPDGKTVYCDCDAISTPGWKYSGTSCEKKCAVDYPGNKTCCDGIGVICAPTMAGWVCLGKWDPSVCCSDTCHLSGSVENEGMLDFGIACGPCDPSTDNCTPGNDFPCDTALSGNCPAGPGGCNP